MPTELILFAAAVGFGFLVFLYGEIQARKHYQSKD